MNGTPHDSHPLSIRRRRRVEDALNIAELALNIALRDTEKDRQNILWLKKDRSGKSQLRLFIEEAKEAVANAQDLLD